MSFFQAMSQPKMGIGGAMPFSTYQAANIQLPLPGLDHSKGQWFMPGEELPPGFVVTAHPEGHATPLKDHAMSRKARETLGLEESAFGISPKAKSSKKNKRKTSSGCCWTAGDVLSVSWSEWNEGSPAPTVGAVNSIVLCVGVFDANREFQADCKEWSEKEAVRRTGVWTGFLDQKLWRGKNLSCHESWKIQVRDRLLEAALKALLREEDEVAQHVEKRWKEVKAYLLEA